MTETFLLLWLSFELIWLGCGGSGDTEDDKGVIRYVAWLEDVDWCHVIIRRVARELQKVCKIHQRVSRDKLKRRIHYRSNERDLLDASIAIHSKVPLRNEFRIVAIALFEIQVSGCTT